MNEELILQMVQPYVKDSSITYDEFYNIFKFLSVKEQYKVTDILYNHGVNLVDEHSEIALDISDGEDFDILYDKSIFEDEKCSEVIVKDSKSVFQTNIILCHLIQDGNAQAKQDLCIKNKKLVDKFVTAYQKRYGNRLDFEDLEQVGFLGLIRAAQKFDFEQETSFSTYAVYWIKQAISREIMDHGFVIRIPVHMMERIDKVMRIYNMLFSENYSLDEKISIIKDELLLSEDEVRECLILKNNFITYASLSSPIGDDEESELIEFIPTEESVGTDKMVETIFLHEALEEAISRLKPREQEVIRLRYGIYDGECHTLEEIGQKYGVTRERIRQIEAKALKKLSSCQNAKKIKDFLY